MLLHVLVFHVQVAADAASTDMCVERACISLLLGDTNAALEALGLEASAAAGSDSSQQQAATSPTQQAARDYVLVSPDSDWGVASAPA